MLWFVCLWNISQVVIMNLISSFPTYPCECREISDPTVGLKEILILFIPMNVKSHNRYQEVFMNFHYSYPLLWVSRSHSRIERAFHPYSPLWVSNLIVGLQESLSLLFSPVSLTVDIKRPSWIFITFIYPYECQDLIVGLKELFIFIHPYECQNLTVGLKRLFSLIFILMSVKTSW